MGGGGGGGGMGEEKSNNSDLLYSSDGLSCFFSLAAEPEGKIFWSDFLCEDVPQQSDWFMQTVVLT